MIRAGIRNVEFIAMNTDQQALNKISAKKFPIGSKLTKGLGAGANPDVGKEAAEESREDIKKVLEGADLLFIAAGMGGGTGTGAAPVVANIAKQMGILTIAVVTKPFSFEGIRRMKNAEMGIENLKGNVDSLVVVQNEKLNKLKEHSIVDAFAQADEILLQGIRGITDIIVQNGRINLDLADVKTVIRNSGMAHMGIGVGKGEDKVISAIKDAVYSPLLETTIQGAASIIINFRGGQTMMLNEIRNGVDLVRQVTAPDANILFGVCIDDTLKDEVQVTLIATGFNGATRSSTGFFDGKSQQQQGKPQQQRPDNGGFGGYQQNTHGGFGGYQQQQGGMFGNVGNSNQGRRDGFGETGGSIPLDDDPNIPPFLRKLKK